MKLPEAANFIEQIINEELEAGKFKARTQWLSAHRSHKGNVHKFRRKGKISRYA